MPVDIKRTGQKEGGQKGRDSDGQTMDLDMTLQHSLTGTGDILYSAA